MITGYNTLVYEMWFRQRRWRRDLHLTTSFRISSSFMFCQYNTYLHTKWEFACSVLYKVSSTCVTDGNFSDFSFIQYLTRKLSSSPSINRKDMNWYPNFPSIHDTPYQCQRYQQVKRSKEDTSCCWWQFMCHQLSTVRHPPTQQSPPRDLLLSSGGEWMGGWVHATISGVVDCQADESRVECPLPPTLYSSSGGGNGEIHLYHRMS